MVAHPIFAWTRSSPSSPRYGGSHLPSLYAAYVLHIYGAAPPSLLVSYLHINGRAVGQGFLT